MYLQSIIDLDNSDALLLYMYRIVENFADCIRGRENKIYSNRNDIVILMMCDIYQIKCLPFIYFFQVDYLQESPSSVITIVLSQHLC